MKKKQRSIFRKIFIPILVIMVFQSVMFYFILVYGGVTDLLDDNARDILSERVINRKNEIEGSLNTHWGNITDYARYIGNSYENYVSGEEGTFYEDQELQKQFLAKVSPLLITMLRNNKVNGVFLILNNAREYRGPDEAGGRSYMGVCIRDLDQGSAYTATEDLLIERCPASIITDIGCPLDTWWEALYSFDEMESSDFFYKPLEAAYNHPGVNMANLAYFLGGHNLKSGDKEVVSYSIPLVDKDGYPYAVLGVELTTTYLSSLLQSRELNDHGAGCYILAQYEEGTTDYSVVTFQGVMYNNWFGSTRSFTADRYIEESRLVEGRQGGTGVAAIEDFKIYNTNASFENEHLALIGLVEEQELYRFSNSVKRVLFICSAISLIIGIVAIVVVSKRFAAPITRLAGKVNTMTPKPNFKLDHVGIVEIDQLINSIEVLNHNVSEGQARTEFFSRMSHDLRTPMNAIIGFSSPELLRESSEAQKDEFLNKINSSGRYMLGLINEVLDMTKIESGRMELKEAFVEPKAIWEDVLFIIEEVARQKEVSIIQKIEKLDNTLIMADRQRMCQIFLNLLSNAVKFSAKGQTVVFQVDFLDRTDESITLHIVVKDNGIGMSEEFQSKLYQPFVREDESKEGTGLGLSITKKLVDLMNGTIHCTSIQGKGTEFEVMLTFSIQEVQNGQEETESGSTKNISIEDKLRGKQILVCEDHPLNTQIAKKVLMNMGMKVDTAENGQVGVNRFQESAIGFYDAVLMDIRMPVMNGIEAARAIRALDRDDALAVPIVAMTANAFAEDMAETKAAGMNEHLAKPIDPPLLYKTLADLIQ